MSEKKRKVIICRGDQKITVEDLGDTKAARAEALAQILALKPKKKKRSRKRKTVEAQSD